MLRLKSRLVMRWTEEEKELTLKLAQVEGLEEISDAVRLAIKEALEKRGIGVPANAFTEKPEGRPKEDRQPSLKVLAV